jgi:hypothetical protein
MPAIDVNQIAGMLGTIAISWVFSRARVARLHAKAISSVWSSVSCSR